MNTVKRTPNSDISEIIAKLKYISSDINQDLEVKFKGYTHGQQGFIIQLNYVENINDTYIETWKTISDKFHCEVDLDLNNRTVNMYFEPKIQKVHNYSPIIYLSFMLFSIWMLYSRNSQFLMQNYMNQT